MGRYINWADVLDRYPKLASAVGADEASSHHIMYAEAFVDGRLAPYYTTPFSSNNLTVRDLCIEVVHARYWLGNNKELYEEGMQFVKDFIGELASGASHMVTTSLEVIYGSQGAAYSNTSGQHPTFGLDDYTMTSIDSATIIDERDAQ